MSRLKDALCDLDRFLARWGWLPIHLINIFMVVFFMVFGMGFEIYYAIVQLIDSIDTFHVFAKCTPVADVIVFSAAAYVCQLLSSCISREFDNAACTWKFAALLSSWWTACGWCM